MCVACLAVIVVIAARVAAVTVPAPRKGEMVGYFCRAGWLPVPCPPRRALTCGRRCRHPAARGHSGSTSAPRLRDGRGREGESSCTHGALHAPTPPPTDAQGHEMWSQPSSLSVMTRQRGQGRSPRGPTGVERTAWRSAAARRASAAPRASAASAASRRRPSMIALWPSTHSRHTKSATAGASRAHSLAAYWRGAAGGGRRGWGVSQRGAKSPADGLTVAPDAPRVVPARVEQNCRARELAGSRVLHGGRRGRLWNETSW